MVNGENMQERRGAHVGSHRPFGRNFTSTDRTSVKVSRLVGSGEKHRYESRSLSTEVCRNVFRVLFHVRSVIPTGSEKIKASDAECVTGKKTCGFFLEREEVETLE